MIKWVSPEQSCFSRDKYKVAHRGIGNVNHNSRKAVNQKYYNQLQSKTNWEMDDSVIQRLRVQTQLLAGQRQEAEKKSGDDTLAEPLQKLNIQFLPPHTYNTGKYLGKSLRNNSKPAYVVRLKEIIYLFWKCMPTIPLSVTSYIIADSPLK